MKTQVMFDLTIRFHVIVEHGDDDELDTEKLEQLASEMTPYDWFNHGAEPPEIDVDLWDANENQETDFYLVNDSLQCASYYHQYTAKGIDPNKPKTKTKEKKQCSKKQAE